MAAISTCPDEPELLAVATGEPAGAAMERHLDACPDCRERVERLRAELMALRQDFRGGRDASFDQAGPGGEQHPDIPR
jgi:hypothetical protein